MAENIEKLDPNSLDLTKDKKRQLKQLFPEVFSEDQIDFEKLKLILGEDAAAGSERYELSWAGKYEAFKEIQKQTTATLIPDREGSVNFDTSENIFIEGENLEVLRVLQKSYYAKIKMIYIDPPYNTGNDHFVYPDDFAERLEGYQKRAGIKDEEGFLNKQDLWKKNTKENGQFHSVWLSMMYPRLYLARNLLREDGLIFVSIDDTEVANLRLLMDTIFGEENFIAQITWEKRYTRSNDAKLMASVIDYLLLYRKSAEVSILREPRTEKANSIYTNPDNDPRGLWTSVSYVSQRTKAQRPNLSYIVKNPHTGEEIEHPTNAWKYSPEQYNKHVEEDRLFWGATGGHKYPRLKKFLSEMTDGLVPINLWHYKVSGTIDEGTKEVDDLVGKSIFDYPKPIKVLQRMMNMATEKDNQDIILDFFSGSGSLGHAVLDANFRDGGNRKFILVQMPEAIEENSQASKAGYRTIADIAKARIQKVIERIQSEVDKNKKEPELFKNEDQSQDLGFKSFRLAHSNFKTWRPDTTGKEALMQQLDVFQDSLKGTTGQEALVYELLLKTRRSLTAKVESQSVEYEGEETPYYLVEDGQLLFALDAINASLIQEILSIKPKAVIVLDSLFKGDDALMTNTHLQLKEADIDFKVI